MESPKKQRDVNIWFIATVILAVALVLVLVLKKNSNTLMGPDGKESPMLQPREASTKLLTFLTEVNNTPDKGITLNDIVEESGLYKLNVTYPYKNPGTGEISDKVTDLYLSKDAKIFIPQAVNLDDAIAKFEEYKQSQSQKPVDTSTTTPPLSSNTTTPRSPKN